MSEPAKSILWEKEGEITVVRFTADKVVENEYSIHAHNELEKLAQSVGGKMLFSLDNVTFMSSFGIAALLSLAKTLRALGGELKVCDAQPLISEVLVAGGFGDTLAIYDTQAEAMAAFEAGQ